MTAAHLRSTRSCQILAMNVSLIQGMIVGFGARPQVFDMRRSTGDGLLTPRGDGDKTSQGVARIAR